MDAAGYAIPTASAATFLNEAVSWINTQRERDCGDADELRQYALNLLPPPDKTAIEVEDGRVVALVVSIGGGNMYGGMQDEPIIYLLQQDGDGSVMKGGVKARLPCFAKKLTLTGPLHTSYSLLALLQIFDVSRIEAYHYGISVDPKHIKPIGVCEMMTEVRKLPSWPRSWANFSLLQLCSHRNAWANLHILGQPNTVLASGGDTAADALAAVMEHAMDVLDQVSASMPR
jgi:hypothetical protein